MATMARGLALAGLDPVRRHLAQLPYLWYRFLRPTKLSTQEYWKYPRLRERTATENKGAGSSAGAGR